MQKNDINVKVSIKPFQRFAVSKGSAFGRSPQRAELLCLHKRRRVAESVRGTVSA